MATYLDFLDWSGYQQALQNAQAVQQQERLAVTPQPALGPLLHEAAARQRTVQGLALGERRLGVARAAQRAEQRQFPWTVGLGILDVGVGALAGYRSLQQAQEFEKRQARLDAVGAERLATLRSLTQAVQGMQARRRNVYTPTAPETVYPTSTTGTENQPF